MAGGAIIGGEATVFEALEEDEGGENDRLVEVCAVERVSDEFGESRLRMSG